MQVNFKYAEKENSEILEEAVDKEKNEKMVLFPDESRDNQAQIQKITDEFIALIEKNLSFKEKEILKV